MLRTHIFILSYKLSITANYILYEIILKREIEYKRIIQDLRSRLYEKKKKR